MTDESLTEQAYRTLKQRILVGELSSVDDLTERSLAEQSGISRTPLRGAISRLETEGVISRLQNGTLMIREVTLEQLLEISEVRRLLEGTAAARAAETGPHPELADIRATMQRYVEGGETAFDEFWHEDDRFHRAVAEAAGFVVLPEMLAEMRETARRCTISRTHDGFAEQAAEHLAVLDAIDARNPEAACAAMEAHFISVRKRFLAWLARR